VRHPFLLDGVHFFDLPHGSAIGVDDGFVDDLADEWHVSSSHKQNKNRQAFDASRLKNTAVRSGNPDQAGTLFNSSSKADADETDRLVNEYCL